VPGTGGAFGPMLSALSREHALIVLQGGSGVDDVNTQNAACIAPVEERQRCQDTLCVCDSNCANTGRIVFVLQYR
jgi:hypothetical protein